MKQINILNGGTNFQQKQKLNKAKKTNDNALVKNSLITFVLLKKGSS